MGKKITTDEAARRAQLLKKLNALYPEPASELVFRNEYELVVAVVLSAQCTDRKVNEVTPELFKRYPSFTALKGAPLSEVEKIIRPINYYRTKAKNIVALAAMIDEQHGGRLPLNHEALIELPGVGNKTANVVLSEQRAAHTFPVDTHVFRVSKRLDLARGKDVLAVEDELKAAFPSHVWRNLHHWLIFHGRRVCRAPRPLCEDCALFELCPKRGVAKVHLPPVSA